MKPAFDDLDDIGFDLDSDREIEFGGNVKKPEEKLNDILANKNKDKHKEDTDNGLFVDNDFGDDFEEDDYDDDFEQEDKQKSGKKDNKKDD